VPIRFATHPPAHSYFDHNRICADPICRSSHLLDFWPTLTSVRNAAQAGGRQRRQAVKIAENGQENRGAAVGGQNYRLWGVRIQSRQAPGQFRCYRAGEKTDLHTGTDFGRCKHTRFANCRIYTSDSSVVPRSLTRFLTGIEFCADPMSPAALRTRILAIIGFVPIRFAGRPPAHSNFGHNQIFCRSDLPPTHSLDFWPTLTSVRNAAQAGGRQRR
jgi:hypothetical protein